VTDNEVPSSITKAGLAICIMYFLLSGWFVYNEYFIVGAEVVRTGPTVLVILVSCLVGVVLSIGLMTPLSLKLRMKLRMALGISGVISAVGLLLYLALRT